MNTKIQDRITKLLALAGSPNENEAKAALLRARELMAKHKLRPEDIEKKDERVVRSLVDVTCTKITNPWAVSLASIIGGHYCCKAYTSTKKKAKTSTIGFVGLEEDIAVCRQIYLYAHDCVEARCILIRENHRRQGYSGKEIREMCNAYGYGFCSGLQAAFDEQSTQHQEWGLVMTVPQAVTDSMRDMSKPQIYGKADFSGWRHKFGMAGFDDGKKFDPGHRLAGSGDRDTDMLLGRGS